MTGKIQHKFTALEVWIAFIVKLLSISAHLCVFVLMNWQAIGIIIGALVIL